MTEEKETISSKNYDRSGTYLVSALYCISENPVLDTGFQRRYAFDQ